MEFFEIWIRILKALVEIFELAVSNKDLKQFFKSDILEFAGCVFKHTPFKQKTKNNNKPKHKSKHTNNINE